MMTGLVNIHCVVGTSEQWIEGGIPVWTGLFTDGSCHWILHLSIWWFGYLNPIVCMTCTEDEQICLLALRQPGGVNEHQWQTKGKKHSFSIWVKDRLVWTGLTKFKQPPPFCWKGELWAEQVFPQSNTSVFILQCLFLLCGLPCFVCQNWELVPVQPHANCKTIPIWWTSALH